MKRKTINEERSGKLKREDMAYHIEKYGEKDSRIKKAKEYGHRKPYAEFLPDNDIQKEQSDENSESD